VSERESSLSSCPSCGRRNRVRPAAAGAPHCGSCGAPLPWLVEADEGSLAALVEQSPLPVLVDFWAPWCGPCRMVAPAVERVSRELAGRLKVAKVNTDQAPSVAQRFGVRSIPTLALVEHGRERGRVVGAQDAGSLRRWLSAQLEASPQAR
jgi:thioredoxin 2